MQKRTRNILLGLIVVIVIVVAGLAYVWISGGSGEASEEISAPTIEVEETEEAEQTVLFRIVSEESEVRFLINEVLRGNPTTVVGSTDQVAGDILVNFANPEASQLGTIRINVRTLQTDNEFRNRAIRSQILNSSQDEFEFSEFVPTSLESMPESVTIGQSFDFQVVGDLTVRDITNSVSFAVTATLVSETRLEGAASATITRESYNLLIPSAPGVADVSEEVILELDFVAVAVE